MVDTVRTLSYLLATLFQDGQAADDISEQDVRDMIVSLACAHGSASMEANASATTIATPGTYELIAGTHVVGGMPRDMTESVAGRLTYTGASDKHFHVVSNLDVLVGSNNQIVSFQWFKNGSTPIKPPVKRKVSTGVDIGAMAIHCDVTLSLNDYIELKVTNDTSTATVTIQDLYLFAMGMIS